MNKKVITEKLLETIWACEASFRLRDDPYLITNTKQFKTNLTQVTNAFSGSWLGYHANIYYKGFNTPRPGDHFSSEWGMLNVHFNEGTSDNWIEYSREQVAQAIYHNIDDGYIGKLKEICESASTVFKDNDETIRTIVDTVYKETKADTLDRIRSILADIDRQFNAQKVVDALRPKGSVMSRDSTAITQGIMVPVHVAIQAEQLELWHPFSCLLQLIACAKNTLKYLEINDLIERPKMESGHKVFIGHGGSPLWRELKDFLHDRLSLDWDEFKREPVAGLMTAERLSQMLQSAGFAFLIMTAEDEHADKSMHARENVIHEVGLFQGRLGFRRAIVLLEDGCAEFSNIHGLSQIRFPKGVISASFEEIRGVLEREGII